MMKRFNRQVIILLTLPVLLLWYWNSKKNNFHDGNVTGEEAAGQLNYNVQRRVPRRLVKDFQCSKLFQRLTEEEITQVLHFMSTEYDKNNHLPTDDIILNRAKNCPRLMSTGYITEGVTKEELDFPIAFSIMMHQESAQTERLLRLIYRPHNLYCIHIDRKSSPIIHKAMQAVADCFPNVFIASSSHDMIYASITRVEAELTCMRDCFKTSKAWKYYINLASQVFPLRTNAELVRALTIYNGSNDIEGIPAHKNRYEFKWKPTIGNCFNYEDGNQCEFLERTDLKHESPPHGLTITKGSAYGVFSRGFVDYLLHDKISQDLLRWSKETYSPDEHFWSTLHFAGMNPHLSPPPGSFKGDYKRSTWMATYAEWYLDSCPTYTMVRNVCINGIQSLYRLSLRPEFTANKFLTDFHPLAWDCMEEWYYNRTTESADRFDYTYYEGLNFIQYSNHET